MSVVITNGWMSGTLKDDKGVDWPVSQSRQGATGAEHANPNLVLHTTETDHLITKLAYPSNFQTGEGKIVQHIQLGYSGDSVWTYDRDTVDIEMVGRSKTGLWLPGEPTLGPTIALVAWLHKTNRINTGLVRPYNYPDVLDNLPAAITTYYRRHDPRDKVGVYGHVDLDGGNSHWDPGSFNYTKFFERVHAALGGDDTKMFKDWKAGWAAHEADKPLDPAWNDDKKAGYRDRQKALSDSRSKAREIVTAHVEQYHSAPTPGVPAHTHTVTGEAT